MGGAGDGGESTGGEPGGAGEGGVDMDGEGGVDGGGGSEGHSPHSAGQLVRIRSLSPKPVQ